MIRNFESRRILEYKQKENITTVDNPILNLNNMDQTLVSGIELSPEHIAKSSTIEDSNVKTKNNAERR